jgi:hypothetical protein
MQWKDLPTKFKKKCEDCRLRFCVLNVRGYCIRDYDGSHTEMQGFYD